MSSNSTFSTALVVTTLNGGDIWRESLRRFREQQLRPEHLLVIDSSSDDDSAEQARAAGFRVVVIPRHEFNHGGTRQMALGMVPDVDIVIYMTQDSILAHPESLVRLVETFADDRVGASYGRQLPRPEADPIETHARLFNYPAIGYRRSLADASQFGIKTAFFSNSFGAYRRAALVGVGGFPKRLVVGDDVCAATKVLSAGWQLEYCAEAQVYHSHPFTWSQYVRRNFDVGVFHSREKWVRELLGGAESEGLKFVKSELSYLAERRPELIPRALSCTIGKLLGYKLGMRERLLPARLKLHLSMQQAFWQESGCFTANTQEELG